MRGKQIYAGATLTIAVLLLSVYVPVSHSANAYQSASTMTVAPTEDHWYHYYGFYWDDRTVGTLCDKTPGFGYSGDPAQGTITVNETNFDDSIVMKFNKTGTTASLLATYTRELSGDWRVTFDLSCLDADSGLGLWLYDGSTIIVGTGFDESGKIFVYDSAETDYDDIVANTTYHFDLQVHTGNDTYAVYLNDTLLEAGDFNAAAGDVDTIDTWKFIQWTSSSGISYVDNIEFWTWADYDYETDDFLDELVDALDWVIDNKYQAGATGEIGGTGIITGYEYEANSSFPRQVATSTMDAAIVAYEVTLQAKYYDVAVDIGRWLDTVVQKPDGYYSNTGGEGINGVDNVLTSLECAGAMMRLYELTNNPAYLTSATQAIDYQIENAWNDTLDLFNDKPTSEWARINLNTAAAKNLAYAYRLTGEDDYYQRAADILTTLPSYMEYGDPGESPSTNYTWGWYNKSIAETGFQGWDYESYTANGYGAAVYQLQQAGIAQAQIDTWTGYLEREIFTLTGYGLWYGMAKNVSAHNYLESLQAYCYYNLLSNYSIPQFEYVFKSMIEYATDRATVTLSEDELIPTNLYYDAPTIWIAEYTSLGQLYALWDWEKLPDFNQPYRLSLNSTANLCVSGDVVVHDLSQTGQELSWTSAATGAVQYTVIGLSSANGYRVYQDGEVISTGIGAWFTFSATGSGDFIVEVWNTNTVSSMIVLTVNMIGLGIVVSVIAGFVMPFARDIKAGRPIKTERAIRDLIKTVVFIVIGLLMWGLLHQIAIG